MLTQADNKKIPILMYHSISSFAGPKFKQFTVPVTLFAEHMSYLHRTGYTPITVTQFIHMRAQSDSALPERPVVITFDDGFADFFTEVLPILKKYGFTATLYVATLFINSTSHWLQREGEATRPMLTWDQLIEASAYGIECGAHSHSHPQLDTLPLSIVRKEIVQSKKILEHHLDQAVSSFAYPYGYYTFAVRQQVREAGYTSACAVKYAMSSEISDPYALARLMVRSDTSVDAFAALLTGHSTSLITTIYTRTRTPVWQLARRSSASIRQYLQERSLVVSPV